MVEVLSLYSMRQGPSSYPSHIPAGPTSLSPPPSRRRQVPSHPDERLPHCSPGDPFSSENAESRAPPVVYRNQAFFRGALPTHDFRAHNLTPADNVTWSFGGCDRRGCSGIYCASKSVRGAVPFVLGRIYQLMF